MIASDLFIADIIYLHSFLFCHYSLFLRPSPVGKLTLSFSTCLCLFVSLSLSFFLSHTHTSKHSCLYYLSSITPSCPVIIPLLHLHSPNHTVLLVVLSLFSPIFIDPTVITLLFNSFWSYLEQIEILQSQESPLASLRTLQPLCCWFHLIKYTWYIL